MSVIDKADVQTWAVNPLAHASFASWLLMQPLKLSNINNIIFNQQLKNI